MLTDNDVSGSEGHVVMRAIYSGGTAMNNGQDRQEWLTKSDWVYHRLREDIMNGLLRPDDRLVVSSIAQHLGVSPMPVREALNRLIQDGLIQMTPHAGARVVSIDLPQLCEITAVRRQLETMAARLAVPNMDAALFARLDAMLSEMEACLKPENARAYESLNREFHQAIYARCANQFLYELILSLWERSAITRMSLVHFSSQNPRSFEEHQRWVEAARQGDADRVASIVNDHLRATVEMLIRELQSQQKRGAFPQHSGQA